MLRKLALWTSPAVLAAGLVIGMGGTASAMPLPLTGHVTCSTFIGKGKFGPGLTANGTSSVVKIAFKGKASACTGGSFVSTTGVVYTVTSAKVVGAGYFVGTPASSCGDFEGAVPLDHVGVIKMKVAWKLTPPLSVAPSIVTYGPTTSYSATTPPLGPMSLDLGVLATPPTATTVTGSYAGSTAQNTLMNIPTPPGGCPVGPPWAFATGSLAF